MIANVCTRDFFAVQFAALSYYCERRAAALGMSASDCFQLSNACAGELWQACEVSAGLPLDCAVEYVWARVRKVERRALVSLGFPLSAERRRVAPIAEPVFRCLFCHRTGQQFLYFRKCQGKVLACCRYCALAGDKAHPPGRQSGLRPAAVLR